MAAILRDFYQEWTVYRADETPRVLHAFKSALAVIVSMVICMRLELRGPGTSMVSAVIVMIHQQSGMVIARAFYRTLGICCGSLAGLTLISLFAQQPLHFLMGLAVWVGVFVAGSSYYKNFQSYGFVLSGYAACITTVPEWANPYDVTTNIIHTVSEVVIGVATGSVISALVFPQKVVPALVKWRVAALASLLSALRAAAQTGPLEDPLQCHMKLVKDSASIEDLRTAAVFEDPEMRLRDDALIELDRTFLESISTVLAVHRARQIAQIADPETKAQVDGLFARLVNVSAAQDEADAKTDGGVAQLSARLSAMKEALPLDVERDVNEAKARGAAHARVIEVVGAEVYLAASSLLDFCNACKVSLDPSRVAFTLPIVHAIAFMRSVPIRSSAATAFASGLRAATAVAVVGVAWIASGWTNGFSAVVSAGITSGFYTLSPTPVTSSWQAFTGCLFAAITGFLINFIVEPGLGDVTFYALALGFVIFCGSYVNTFPKYAGLGAIFNVYFCYVLTPTNVAQYDPPYLLDRSFALLIGIAVSAVAFSLVLPHEGERRVMNYVARIRDLVLNATLDPVDMANSVQIGRALRDLIVRIANVPNVSTAYRDKHTNWAFGQLWIATALLEVRAISASEIRELPSTWGEVLRDWLRAMERVAQGTDASAVDDAVTATDRGLLVLEAHLGQHSSREARAAFRLRAWLYSARTALTGQLPVASPLSEAVS
jgi:uncharacterized membrane protein YccC